MRVSIDDALLLLGGIILGVALVVLVLGKVAVGAQIVLIAAIVESTGIREIATIGTVKVSPLDLSTSVLLAVLTVGWARGSTLNVRAGFLATLGLFAVVRGANKFGLERSINEGRYLLYFSVTLLFVVSIRHQIEDSMVERLWVQSGAALTVFGMVRALVYGLGSADTLGSRILNSQQSLILAQAGIFALLSPSPKIRRFGLAAIFMVVLSMQRTVWATTLVALAILFIRSERLADISRARHARRLLTLGGVTATTAVVLGPSSISDSILGAGEVSTDSGTLGWRLASGSELLDNSLARTGVDALFGQPAGAGFGRFIAGKLWTASPHNMYLMMFVSLGAFGLLSYIILLVTSIWHSRRSIGLNAIVVSLIVYGLGYQVPPEQAVLIGLGFGQLLLKDWSKEGTKMINV